MSSSGSNSSDDNNDNDDIEMRKSLFSVHSLNGEVSPTCILTLKRSNLKISSVSCSMCPGTIWLVDHCLHGQFNLSCSKSEKVIFAVIQSSPRYETILPADTEWPRSGCSKQPLLQMGRLFVCLGCLTTQQQASVSQGRICSDNLTCCHTEVEVADQTFYLTQSQYTDTGPTSPSADPITPGAWQGSHWSVNF